MTNVKNAARILLAPISFLGFRAVIMIAMVSAFYVGLLSSGVLS